MQAVPVFATDEYGAPLVTATPTPDPHTAYYKQAADTDSIKNWVKGPQIEGESAILVDMFTGAVLYSKNADKAQYPASITKIMTALLGCESLDPSQKFAMTASAARSITETNSSSIYADTDEEFTIEQALMAVMLQSANEMTLAVAELTSGSSRHVSLDAPIHILITRTVFRMKSIIQQLPIWPKLRVQHGLTQLSGNLLLPSTMRFLRLTNLPKRVTF